ERVEIELAHLRKSPVRGELRHRAERRKLREREMQADFAFPEQRCEPGRSLLPARRSRHAGEGGDAAMFGERENTVVDAGGYPVVVGTESDGDHRRSSCAAPKVHSLFAVKFQRSTMPVAITCARR